MNRDTREIFDIYRFHGRDEHTKLLRRSLNAAVILCEDYCIMPPGFVIEDEIAFGLAESQREFLQARVLQFPMRETSLSDYAEKKRLEYYPLRSRYSGLFNDTRLDFIGRHAQGLIPRKSNIGEQIIRGWEEGADNSLRAWTPVKRVMDAPALDLIRDIPAKLSNEGTALTWSAIAPHLPNAAKIAEVQLRNALQHTYFKQYCDEFDLIVLSSIPHMPEEFHLPKRRRSYDYHRFATFLQAVGITRLLLDSTARLLMTLKYKSSFISFIDAYVELSEASETHADLAFRASRAVRSSRFRWVDVEKRFDPIISPPSELELIELDHAFAELAALLNNQNGLQARTDQAFKQSSDRNKGPALGVNRMSEIVLFVALQEEFDVLSKTLGLNRNASPPAGTGQVGNVRVDVLCPRDMGRVPAAVEVTKYLESRKATPPRLILALGLAGGFPEEKSTVGHIICPTTVVDLASRKVIDGSDARASTKFRRKDFPLNPALQHVLASDKFDTSGWINESIEVAKWPSDRRPSLHSGLIASIDEVISSDDWRAKLLQHTEKLLGVEMEAGGVCAAAQRYGVPVSMLRVVSDTADPAKADDKWRSIGMVTVALLIKRLSFDEVLSAMGV